MRKEVICKTNTFKSKILKRILIDRIKTFDQNKIGDGFNKFLY